MNSPTYTRRTTDESSSAALLQLINGFRISQMIAVAARLGLADLVAEAPHSSTELAEHTGMYAPALYRLLRALTSVGLFSEDAQGRFALMPLADALRSEVPGSLRGWAIQCGEPTTWQAWGALDHSVQTGESAFRQVFGMDVWDYRAQHPDANAIFNAAMTSLSGRDIPAIQAAYDFTPLQTIVDVGGGHGALLAALLQEYPAMQGILFDQPHVVATAAPVVEAAGIADRCSLVGGSFFETVPHGGDAYLLRAIVHDWDDDHCVAILRICHTAMPTHAKLLIVDRVINAATGPDPATLFDIHMLVIPGGRERTEGEFRALLAKAGFAVTKVYPTFGPSSIIEGVRA